MRGRDDMAGASLARARSTTKEFASPSGSEENRMSAIARAEGVPVAVWVWVCFVGYANLGQKGLRMATEYQEINVVKMRTCMHRGNITMDMI